MQLIIDTDPGMGTLDTDPEDSLALALAAYSPEVELRLVTVVQGNVPVHHGYANAAHVLQLVGREDVPVKPGARQPLVPGRRPGPLAWLAERGAADRLIPAADLDEVPTDAAAALVASVETSPEPVTLVAIGPLTNVANALSMRPEIAGRIGRLVVMGGAYEVPGNITPTAEFNFWMDPEAAQAVLDAGLHPTLVGLDVCHRTRLTKADVGDEHDTEFGKFVEASCASWFHDLEGAGDVGLHLFDSLAVAAALQPELLRTVPAWVAVETAGDLTAGTSVAYLPGANSAWTRPSDATNADVAVEVDLEKFQALFAERVLAHL